MARKQQAVKQLYYKIGEACRLLEIQPYVLRYWETEFPVLAPSKSKSGQRVYSDKELSLIRRIKELLYEEGYTIAGAKKRLEAELDPISKIPSALPDLPPVKKTDPAKRAPQPAVGAASGAESNSVLDSTVSEKLKTLHEGITAALRDAREILSRLNSS